MNGISTNPAYSSIRATGETKQMEPVSALPSFAKPTTQKALKITFLSTQRCRLQSDRQAKQNRELAPVKLEGWKERKPVNIPCSANSHCFTIRVKSKG